MSDRTVGRLIGGSAAIAAVGAIVTVVYFFQPWRSCDYEDTSVGCAMLPADATVMLVAVLVTLAACGLLVIGLVVRRTRASEAGSRVAR